MLVNVVLFIVVMRSLLHASSTRKSSGGLAKDLSQRWTELRAMASIFMVLGLSWVFGALVNVGNPTASLVFEYIFAICAALQGFFIFIFHCIKNQQVRDEISSMISPATRSSMVPPSKRTAPSKNTDESSKHAESHAGHTVEVHASTVGDHSSAAHSQGDAEHSQSFALSDGASVDAEKSKKYTPLGRQPQGGDSVRETAMVTTYYNTVIFD
jgi:hypothetical protein